MLLRRRRREAEPPRTVEAPAPFRLTDQQVEFFRTFGFVVLRGLYRSEIGRIQAGFEEVFANEPGMPLDPANEFHRTSVPEFEGETRFTVPLFIERSENLAWLRDDQRMQSVARSLLGDDFVYAESDGNLFNCDVLWHLDAYGARPECDYIKVYFYLEPLDRDSGALRVLPGSHQKGEYTESLRTQMMPAPARVPEIFGVDLDEVPSWALEVEPGDVIVSDWRTLHSSFKGGIRRRLFTVNYSIVRNNGA